jgi:hypothetical protein
MTDEIQNPVGENPLETLPDPIPEVVVDPTPTSEHPAVSLIQEIETHLANIPAFGYSEQAIRKLVTQLKALF